MPLTRYHATVFLSSPASYALEELRRAWDPGMARQIAAHVTLIYPEEITDPARASRTNQRCCRPDRAVQHRGRPAVPSRLPRRWRVPARR